MTYDLGADMNIPAVSVLTLSCWIALYPARCFSHAAAPSESSPLAAVSGPVTNPSAKTSNASLPQAPSTSPGLKQQLLQAGIKIDLRFSGLVQGQASGSNDSAAINALTGRGTTTQAYGGGRFDALMELDSTRLGLWRGGKINGHLEIEGGPLPGWRGGSFWPVNTAAILPLTPPGEWSLSSLYVRQTWGGTRVMAGKVNVIDLQSQSPFFGGWGSDRFQNLALVLPPTGVTPATLMAASITQQIGELTFTSMVYDPNDRTEKTFEKLFADGLNGSFSVHWNGRLWQRMSNIGISYVGTTRKVVSLKENYLPYALRQRGLATPDHFTINFGHLVWPSSTRSGQGVGIYGRLGATGGDPNPIQSSLAVGLSGEGFWPARPLDTFGVGLYRYNWTNGLSAAIGAPVRNETGVELYYNIALNPWLTLSPSLQVIQPATVQAPLLTLIGFRSVLRF